MSEPPRVVSDAPSPCKRPRLAEPLHTTPTVVYSRDAFLNRLEDLRTFQELVQRQNELMLMTITAQGELSKLMVKIQRDLELPTR